MQRQTNKTNTTKEPSKSKILTIQNLFVYLLFPLSQMFFLFIVAQEIVALYSIPMPFLYTIISVLLVLVTSLVFFLFSRNSRKQTEISYRELTNMQQFKKKHYENIQASRLELEHLKNSFEQQLNEISLHLKQEEPEKALELLSALSTNIAATKEYPFCPNPVITAVLWEKEQQCVNKNIPFQADLQIGDCATVNPMHLCSIFSNLLDNAIEACSAVPENKFIHLTAKQTGDFIHIKLKNSSLPPSRPKQGHGYGHRILKDITEQYSGSFRTTYTDNIYEVFLSIQTP